MSDFHQFFSVNHAEFIHLLHNSNVNDLTDQVVQSIGREFDWPEEVIRNTSIREACVKVFDRHDYHCDENGFVYFGLMLLCEHERLSADGWKVQYSEAVADFVKGAAVSPQVKEIFAGLVHGRDPFFKLMDIENQDVIACFIRTEESQKLIAEIEGCDDFAEGKIPDPDVEEIIFNEFLPAIDQKLPDEHCIAVFTL